MRTYSLSHLPDATLLRDLAALVTQDRVTTAAMLAHLAEVDARRLYLPAAYPSMYAYCVGELRLAEDAACKRIQAARAARRFPAIFPAVADGRLHLTAVCLLAPYLTPENAGELLAAAAGKSKGEIEAWLAQRFPRSDVLPLVVGLTRVDGASGLLALGRGGVSAPERIGTAEPQAPIGQLAPGQVDRSAREPREAVEPRPRVRPFAPRRFALEVTIGQETHDKLRYAQALLGHAIPAGELAEVLDRALDALIRQPERRKFAACRRPRQGLQRTPRSPRYIPAAVKRTVWERDEGRCTFVSDSGRRCPARTRLEFDHVDPVARGGQATVAGIRLRCRAHNQYGAEQIYGAGFMQERRGAARRAATGKRAGADDIVPWLRALGFSADEARHGAARCASMRGAPLEERVRIALAALAPLRRHTHPRMDGPGPRCP